MQLGAYVYLDTTLLSLLFYQENEVTEKKLVSGLQPLQIYYARTHS